MCEGPKMGTLEKCGHIFILTLPGDGKHRQSPTLINAIVAALRCIRVESTPGSALVTTAEGKFFSNGFDLNWAKAVRPGFRSRLSHMIFKFKQIIADLISIPMLTIAVVTGHASAAGFILALSHNYVYMRKDRGFLYMSELDIGLPFPEYIMTVIRSKITAPMARREVALRAAKIKAQEAVEMGIIDAVHDSPGETVEAALCLGEELAGRKWDGEVYAPIREGMFPEVLEMLGLAEKKTAIPLRL
ncbi:enoyl-CoA delta isomerase 2, peroxisomal-like [Magnolia sinica]|uniref:enoyl-CoA delta isomerase 2, peroxisomal-like n=1 Tax=Magnolia sinica TaxID=86752 RepID=UPI002659DABA|nr:enoyl-CoA delta isomerase 2, peroxisomal-like [Magnolia sinica]